MGAGGVSIRTRPHEPMVWVRENETTKEHFMSILSRFQDAVQLTAAGIAKKNAPAPAAASPKKTAPLIELLAWRSPLKNPGLLIAYHPKTDPNNPNNLVSVNVRSNLNFIPGMTLQAHQVSEKVFDLFGPLPRNRGRW